MTDARKALAVFDRTLDDFQAYAAGYATALKAHGPDPQEIIRKARKLGDVGEELRANITAALDEAERLREVVSDVAASDDHSPGCPANNSYLGCDCGIGKCRERARQRAKLAMQGGSTPPPGPRALASIDALEAEITALRDQLAEATRQCSGPCHGSIDTCSHCQALRLRTRELAAGLAAEEPVVLAAKDYYQARAGLHTQGSQTMLHQRETHEALMAAVATVLAEPNTGATIMAVIDAARDAYRFTGKP